MNMDVEVDGNEVDMTSLDDDPDDKAYPPVIPFVAQLSPPTPIPPFDFKACIICQKITKEDFAKKIDSKKIERIIKCCKDHHKSKTGKYEILHSQLKHRTLQELANCQYHNSCSRQMSRDQKYIVRAQKSQHTLSHKTNTLSCKTDRISRSSMSLFDKEKCFFCQEDTPEQTHLVAQFSKSDELKSAFKDTPIALGMYKIRYERALDATAGDIRYHNSCWRNIIFKRVPEFELPSSKQTPESFPLNANTTCVVPNQNEPSEDKENHLFHIILTDITSGVIESIANENILSIRDIVEVYDLRCKEAGVFDGRTYSSKRQRIKRYIEREIPEISFVNSPNKNEPQRLITNDMKALLVHLAILQAKQRDDAIDEVRTLKKAAAILRKTSLDFIKSQDMIFTGTVLNDLNDVPSLLNTFMKWTLAGQRTLNEAVDDDVNRSSLTLSNEVLYKIKSYRQSPYNQSKSKNVRYSNLTKHHMGIGLAVHSLTRDKRVISLLSGYRHSINYKKILEIETSIANGIIEKINKNNGLFVPRNLKKGTIVTFHLDNINWQEDTNYGKDVTNALNLAIFQPNIEKTESSPPLELQMHSQTKKLILNSFNELRYSPKPKKKDFKRTDACCVFTESLVPSDNYDLTSKWLLARSLEFIIANNEALSYKLYTSNLIVPTWSGSNSLLSNPMEKKDLTNVFNVPLINGSASDYSAIFTGISIANGITQYLRGHGSKAIISLDLDLYEKVYLLVNSREDLRDRYILCLGELHITFAFLRAIGTFIEKSGLDDCWIRAKLFGENTCKQVLTCARLNRALQCHESTLIAVNIHMLQVILKSNTNNLNLDSELLINVISEMQHSSQKKDHTKFKDAFFQFTNSIQDMEIDSLLETFKNNHKENSMFQYLRCYLDMLTTLFDFIAASRSRNWKLHLSSLQKMMPAIIMMDRIKYRRWIPVYLADMIALKTNDAETWNYFEEGNFSVQKTQVPFVALGRDHAGEQENKVLKIQGGLQGITKQENARTRYFLIAPILKEIVCDMQIMAGINERGNLTHHHLNPSKQMTQNEEISNLVQVFNEVQLCDISENKNMYNFVTGRVFPQKCTKLLDLKKDGMKLYNDFITKRLQTNSVVDIFEPLTKIKSPIFKKCVTTCRVKANDKIHELSEAVDLFAKCSIVSSTRDVDMPSIVGDYELSSIARSFMKSDGDVNHGGEDKSELVHSICKHVGDSTFVSIEDIEVNVSAIDAMQILQKLKKPDNVSTFSGLAQVFLDRILEISSCSKTIIVAFDEYRPNSLKNATRKIRKGKRIPIQYKVDDKTIIKEVTLTELLSHELTKKDLSIYLQNFLDNYFMNQTRYSYILAGNGKTTSSFTEVLARNNHEEADTLLLYCAKYIIPNETLLIHSNDTDVFVLFVSLLMNLSCKRIIMKWAEDSYIDLTKVSKKLKDKSGALIGLHAFSGNDIVEKFSGKSKNTWVKAFLSADKDIINALISYPNELNTESEKQLERFVCQVYLTKSNVSKLSVARWIKFKSNSSNLSQLPPSPGTFRQHVLRSYWQAHLWINAIKSEIPYLKPELFGWHQIDSGEFAKTISEEPIAPASIIELTSCSCQKSRCSSSRCKCRKLGEICTDLCNCNNCENYDIYCNDDDVDYEEIYIF